MLRAICFVRREMMNKKYLDDMLYAVLRLYWPVLIYDEDIAGYRWLDTLWQVTGYRGEGSTRQMLIQTLSQTRGLGLSIYYDIVKEFQNVDLHHPSFKQGCLILKTQWIIPPYGQSARQIPLRHQSRRRVIRRKTFGAKIRFAS
jgi:hypothetical protein